ncbi:MAG: phenylalanine--tRNA ligase subunit beta [Firmicutes bacterium]|nr:phenylalanine--tRNA ligase subunit beta [Bacillota bacterium]
MLAPIKWLEEYTDINVGVQEFCDRLILSGSNLETVDYYNKDIENVVIGKVLSVEPHPNADKLTVCQLDVGKGEPVQICTGAPNIVPGMKDFFVPVALDGSKVPGPLHGKPKQEGGEYIYAGELRGVASNGMMCNCSELGFPDKIVPYRDKDGIWILDGEYTPGMDILEALQLNDPSIDFEITPNRPDCLSMIGMAREAAATFGTKLRYPETECKKCSPEKSEDYISVEIRRPDLCKRFTCRVVKDIKVEQSPWWMQKYLMQAGMRPINNIVDITNFVMLEYGQPIHAYDINTVKGGKIIVDAAKDGDTFVTLDGNERTLQDNMLTIRDCEGALGIAGIMGGLDSDIKPDTKTVLVESANFLGDSVRTTSKKLNLRTEASGRFEKGIDPNLAKDACDRVCYLIELLGAGTVLSTGVDVYPVPEKAKTMDVRVSRINKVLGIEIPGEQMVEYFKSLEMEASLNGDIITVTPPTVRQDLEIEEDYVEEVARMYGYDKLPTTLPKSATESRISEKQELRNLAKAALRGMGISEFQTYSFVSPKASDKVRIPADSFRRNFVKLINPLGEDTSVMRTMILPNLLDVLALNYARSNADVRGFELGNTFYNNGKGEGILPEEKDALCIAMYAEGETFFTLKGYVEELLAALGIHGAEYEAVSDDPTFHPGRCARVSVEGKPVAVIGQVHPAVTENYNIGSAVYAAEIDFDLLYSLAKTEIKYAPLPKYPAMVRDFAMVVKEEVAAGELEKAIKANAGPLLESVKLFDVYRGAPVLPGFKSVAYSLTYRAADRTLKEGEVNEINQKVLIALKDAYNAVLREM